MKRTEQCQRCKATLSSDLNYCPQCNWKKSRHVIPEPTIEETIDVKETTDVEETIDVEEITDVEETVDVKDKPKNDKTKNDKTKNDKTKILKFKKEKSYQTKAKIVYILPLIFGIFLIIFAIIFASAVSYLLMTGVMNSLGGIGGAGIPMPIDLGPIDTTTMSYIDTIIGMNSFGFEYTGSEIQELTSSSANVMMTAMMDILGAALLITLIEVGIGIFIVFMSRKMYKRTMMR
ncbi:MAG: hypothetical protein ACW9W4_03945 [Candidatus Nitrosopumilus sp. bin_7KS]